MKTFVERRKGFEAPMTRRGRDRSEPGSNALPPGGGSGLENQTALCAPHHLRGVHGGRLRVSGTAPDHLAWALADGTPLGPR